MNNKKTVSVILILISFLSGYNYSVLRVEKENIEVVSILMRQQEALVLQQQRRIDLIEDALVEMLPILDNDKATNTTTRDIAISNSKRIDIHQDIFEALFNEAN